VILSSDKLSVLKKLQSFLLEICSDEDILYRVENSNPWFTPRATKEALNSIAHYLLDQQELMKWSNSYSFNDSKNIGIICAGNIPMVSFHDILCVYASPHRLSLKLSSKDNFLTRFVLEKWMEIDLEWKSRVEFVERIEKVDKIIATGSNNSYQYFEYYFKKFDHILRKNRTSVAIVSANATDKELDGLSDDILSYFGLGCRNVSKIYFENGFNTDRLFERAEKHKYLFEHTKYMNNYDYQRTLLLMNSVPHLSNNFLMIRECPDLFSPISTVHYEWYEKIAHVELKLEEQKNEVQCIIGRDFIPFGGSQSPCLMDYADGIDVMSFLSE
jgi:hypothetical protein